MADVAPAPGDEGAIVVISGIQGAGKTTVADRLARRLPRAARISGDAMQQMIVSGGKWPERRVPSEEATRQLRLRLRHACLLARSFAGAGYTAVVDDIVIGGRVDDLLADLAGERFIFVMLTPRLEVVRARERGRGTHLYREWGWMDIELRQDTRRLGLWLDSSEQTADETAAEILRRAWAEGWVDAPPPSSLGLP